MKKESIIRFKERDIDAFVLNDSPLVKLKSDYGIAFELSQHTRDIWRLTKCGDVILVKVDEHQYGADYDLVQVIRKRVAVDKKHPMVLDARLLCETTIVEPPSRKLFSRLRYDTLETLVRESSTPVAEFNELVVEPTSPAEPFYEKHGYTVRVASTAQDTQCIQKLAQSHAFGYREKHLIGLMLSKNGVDVGALIFDLAAASTKWNKDEIRIFGGDVDHVRANSLVINRIFAPKRVFSYHKMLLEAFFEIAPTLVRDHQYSTVQAVSFDMHPLADHFGFSVVLPPRVSYPIFYYKYLYQDNKGKANTAEEIHQFLDRRREKVYYLLYGNDKTVKEGMRQRVWALNSDEEINRGKLYLLKEGDTVFLCDKPNRKVVGAFEVRGKHSDVIKGYEDYNLIISFGAKHDIPEHPVSETHITPGTGIVEIPEAQALKWLAGSATSQPARPVARSPKMSESKKEYFLVSTSSNIRKGLARQLWALNDSPANRSQFETLKSGDCVYFIGDKSRVLATANVARIEVSSSAEFRRFPLIIHVQNIKAADQPLSEELRSFLKSQKGGIIPRRGQPIFAEAGTTVSKSSVPSHHLTSGKKQAVPAAASSGFDRGAKSLQTASSVASFGEVPPSIQQPTMLVSNQAPEHDGGMWVKPNPKFCTGTKFTVKPKEIFVIQHWDLKNSVFHLIEKSLQLKGFTATHASQKEEQVVFEPIWRQLNECEAVIVDFSNQRPNVYLELGMALVIGKPVIAIIQEEDTVPSDLQQLKWLKYKCATIKNGDKTEYYPDPHLGDELLKKILDTLPHYK